MRTDDLHDVLERAAAPLERPDLARAALAGAHRVRVRRRGLAAVGATVALVSAVVVGTSLAGPRAVERPSPAPAPTDLPTTLAEAIPDEVVEPFWDVAGVGRLPLRESTLPETVEQPAAAPSLADAPVPAAALSLWGEGDTTYLLTPDGEWRSVAHPGPEPALATLSDDGTRLAMPGPAGLEVWDLPTGTPTTLPWPDDARLPVADLVVTLRWAADGEHVLVVGPRSSWWLGLDGSVESLPFPTNRYSADLYPTEDGRVVELAATLGGAGRAVVEWEGGRRVSALDAGFLASLDRAAVGGELIAAARGVGGYYTPRERSDWDGLVVFGRQDMRARAFLPIRDANAAYSDNGRLTVHGFLDEETVLAWVLPEGSEDWSLVAWHFSDGEMTRLAGGDAYARLTDVVPSLLER